MNLEIKKPNGFQSSSFHRTTIQCTPQQLIDLAERLGADYYEANTGEDKTNFDFEFELSDGTYFTVYDWKEYRSVGLDETVDFHIGGKCESDTMKAGIVLNNTI